MMMNIKKRRDAALKKNAFVLFEQLQKSTQDWTSKLTGIQHWQPEHGYDVFVFDPDNQGTVYVLLRRWNEERRKFDEQMFKHGTDHTEPAQAIQDAKEWIKTHWSDLKGFSDDVPENEHNPEVDSVDSPLDIDLDQEKLEEKAEQALEEGSQNEQEAKFENFMDDGVQTPKEKEEIWKQPMLRRLATQMKEVEKDHSQFERALQNDAKKRRDGALEKSVFNLTEKMKTLAEKVKSNA